VGCREGFACTTADISKIDGVNPARDARLILTVFLPKEPIRRRWSGSRILVTLLHLPIIGAERAGAAYSGEGDQTFCLKAISLPGIPIRTSERSDAGENGCGGSNRNAQGIIQSAAEPALGIGPRSSIREASSAAGIGVAAKISGVMILP
jgi:hypothetical protein